jgi:hypothetical protein
MYLLIKATHQIEMPEFQEEVLYLRSQINLKLLNPPPQIKIHILQKLKY